MTLLLRISKGPKDRRLSASYREAASMVRCAEDASNLAHGLKNAMQVCGATLSQLLVCNGHPPVRRGPTS